MSVDTGEAPAPDFSLFTSNRTTVFRYELFDVAESPLGWVDGVTGGSLEYSVATTVRAGGTLEVVDVDGIDWLRARVRPWAVVNGYEWPLGMFVPAAPQEHWRSGHRSWSVELLGKLTTLSQDEVPASVSYPEGYLVTLAVREQIAEAGQSNVAVTDSEETVPAGGVMWEAGTSRLRIINDLLESINYFSLSADGFGQLRAEPYVRPAARPIRYPLVDGADSIYSDEFTRDRDVFSVPNRYVAIASTDGEEESLIAKAENNDPDSPFSFASRGQWVTRTDSGVVATSQASLDEYAHRRLIESSSVTASTPLSHALIPLDLNDVVQFRRIPAGIDARHTVQAMSIPLDPLALMSSTLREVVDL